MNTNRHPNRQRSHCQDMITLMSYCISGSLDGVKQIINGNPNIVDIIVLTNAFKNACLCGHLRLAQWLLQQYPGVDLSFISNDQEYIFRHCCSYGNLLLLQWLLQIKPTIDINACDYFAFRTACCNGRLSVAQWFVQLRPDLYHVDGFNSIGKITYTIVGSLLKHPTVLHRNHIENCPICDEAPSNLQTPCGHQFCEPCLQKWLSDKHSCPYCRANLSNTMTTFQPIMPLVAV
jgi:hypothetical protein